MNIEELNALPVEQRVKESSKMLDEFLGDSSPTTVVAISELLKTFIPLIGSDLVSEIIVNCCNHKIIPLEFMRFCVRVSFNPLMVHAYTQTIANGAPREQLDEGTTADVDRLLKPVLKLQATRYMAQMERDLMVFNGGKGVMH